MYNVRMTVLSQNDRHKMIGIYRLMQTLIVVFLISVFTLILSAQEPSDVIRVDTDVVAFEVKVTDRKGNPVKDLSVDDFRVFDNGVEVVPDFFEVIEKKAAGRPLSIVFALDVSGSMTRPEMEKLKASLDSFIGRLADYNSYFAVTAFGMNIRTISSFTNRPDKLRSSIQKLKHDSDGLSTHAYDAVDHAIRMMSDKGPKLLKTKLARRVVILVTDGFPVGDIVSPNTVIERANKTDTSVFAVILPSYSNLRQTQRPIFTPLEASGIIDQTGGKRFLANDADFEQLFKELEEEIVSTYLIAFYPDKKWKTDGSFREVRIESRKDLIIKQNRSGYGSQKVAP